MIKRLMITAIAVAAASAAAASTVFAAAFGLYALFRETLSPAASAGAVVLVLAVGAGLLALVTVIVAQGGRPKPPPEPSFLEKAAQMAKEKPLLAAGGALAAGLIALKNPQVVASILGAVLASRAADKADRRRR